MKLQAKDIYPDTLSRENCRTLRAGVVGDIALQEIGHVNRKCSVGMSIAKLRNRSRGYGRQAVRLLPRYGFEFLGMERITANTLSENIGARRSLEKCGFIREGKERESVYLNGKKHDKYNYAILRQHRTIHAWRLEARLTCKNFVILHKKPRKSIEDSLRFLSCLTKFLLRNPARQNCAVSP